MRLRHDSVLVALHHQHRGRDRREREPPRRDEGDVVVDQPVRPGALNGATPANVATAATRTGSRAAQASACGPPPEAPNVANRAIPSASAAAATSAATDATSRPGLGLEPP